LAANVPRPCQNGMQSEGRSVMLTMDNARLLERIVADPERCGGRPCVRGTRMEVAIPLDALAEGLNAEDIRDHYPSLELEDRRAAIAYGAELARENL